MPDFSIIENGYLKLKYINDSKVQDEVTPLFTNLIFIDDEQWDEDLAVKPLDHRFCL